MSGHQYFSNPNKLFTDEDDDDIDDNTFLKNSRNNFNANPQSGSGYYDDYESEMEQQRQIFEQKKREIENRTLSSTHRSIGLIRETEQVGVATAEELSRQREQLEKTSGRLDEINTTLRFSQKHLNGLKSVFGGLKNYLSGKSDAPAASPRMTPATSGSNLSSRDQIPQRTADDMYASHPTTRLRGGLQSQSMPRMGAGFQQQLDSNLDEMSNGLARLKNLAIDLNQEIDTQNDLIDDITDKTEVVGGKITKQNKEINRMLTKK